MKAKHAPHSAPGQSRLNRKHVSDAIATRNGPDGIAPSGPGALSATRSGASLAVSCLIALLALFIPAMAHAAVPTEHVLDRVLSLEGDCTGEDGVKDPSCPYLPAPDRPHSFSGPCGVATDPNGDLFVAHPAEGTSEGRIDIFNQDGEFLEEFSEGISESMPCSVAVDSAGNLYVVERELRQVNGI